MHFWKLFALGREHLCGFVNRDGLMAQVVDVAIDFACHPGLRPRSLSATLIDSAGRSTELRAESYAIYPFKVHPLITLFECPLEVAIDGRTGTGHIEMMWPNDLIDYMRERTIEARQGQRAGGEL